MKNSHQLLEAVNLNSNRKEMAINPLYLETVSSIYEAINNGEWETMAQYFSSQMIEHQLYPCNSSKIISYELFFRRLKTVSPDIQMFIDSIYSFGCKVVCRYTVSGTKKGSMLYFLPAHNQAFTLQGVDVFRFVGRQIAEHWGTLNLLPFLRQIKNDCHQLALNC